MAVTIEEVDAVKSGINKQDFESSLQRVSDQIRWIDQQLTLKVNNEIRNSFQNQKNDISDTKAYINNVRI